MDRRAFLKLFGLGTAAAALPVIAEPVRRIWQVPSSAPVGSRLERVGSAELHFGHGYTYDAGTAFTLDASQDGAKYQQRLYVNDEPFDWDVFKDGVTLYTERGPVQVRAYSDQSLWAHGRYGYVITAIDHKAGRITLTPERS